MLRCYANIHKRLLIYILMNFDEKFRDLELDSPNQSMRQKKIDAFCNSLTEHQFQTLIKTYETAIETRKLELELFWKRSFFSGVLLPQHLLDIVNYNIILGLRFFWPASDLCARSLGHSAIEETNTGMRHGKLNSIESRR